MMVETDTHTPGQWVVNPRNPLAERSAIDTIKVRLEEYQQINADYAAELKSIREDGTMPSAQKTIARNQISNTRRLLRPRIDELTWIVRTLCSNGEGDKS